MDNIIESLSNIKLRDDLCIIINPVSSVNLQKCYIPYEQMGETNLTPGCVVSISHKSKKYVCKAFPKFEKSNTVDVYTIVTNALKNDTNIIGETQVSFQKEEQYFHRELEIDVVFDSYDHKLMWSDRTAQFANILRKRVLKPFVFNVSSTLCFNKLNSNIRLGIYRIVVKNAESDKFGTVSMKTKLKINMVTLLQYQQRVNYNERDIDLYGVDTILGNILEIVDYNQVYSKAKGQHIFPPVKQILLAGPSGCGKTTLIHLIAKKINCTVIRIIGQELYSSEPGEAEAKLRNSFKEAFQYAASEGLCIIHLEEVDTLCPDRRHNSSHIARLCTQLLHLLDEAQEYPGIIVLATTNKPEQLDAAVRRQGRLGKEVYIGAPSESERNLIIYNFLKKHSIPIDENNLELLSKSVAEITQGYAGADLKYLCQTVSLKCIDNASREGNNVSQYNTIYDIFRNTLCNMKPASLRTTVEIVPTGISHMSDIGGMTEVKKALEMAVNWPLKYPDAFKKLGIPKTKGVLLYGPPGCAKTSLVRALGARGNFTVLYVTSAQIYSPYVGDAEKAILQLFDRARQNAPAIVFFDEIDSLIGSRSYSGDKSSDVQERILAALLTQMDGIGNRAPVADFTKKLGADGNDIIVIAATNRPKEIDPALLRPGRFDRHIHVPQPDAETRLEILKVLIKTTPVDDSIDLEEISKKTEYYSGADLKNLHTEAVLYAMKKEGINVSTIRQCHFDEVLKIMKPSLTPEMCKLYEINIL